MKKLLSILTLLIITFVSVLGLTACVGSQDDKEPEHTHNFKTELSFDQTHHWHKCESEECNQISGKMEHVFDNDCDDTCICGYQRTAGHDFSGQWLKDETKHWRKCQHANCTEIEETEHSFGPWKNFDAVQHTKVCECGLQLYEQHSWDNGQITNEPSCEQIGIKTYTCTGCGATKQEEFGEIGHEYSVTIKWIADEAVIYLICIKDNSHRHIDNMVIEKSQVAATCEEDAKVILNASYEFDGQTNTDTKTITQADTAIGHDYEFVGFEWANDYSTAKAKFVCANDEEHEEIVTATISSSTTDATCEVDGETVYTAKVIFEDVTYTDTQKQTIEHAGHDYEFAGFEWANDYSTAKAKLVCRNNESHTRTENLEVYENTYQPTCDKDGYVVYSVLFRYEEITHQDSKEVTIENSATGHDFEDWGWSWEDDYSGAELSLYCNTCRTNYYYDGQITSETFPATCSQAGRTEYTATVVVQGETYTKTETQIIPATHNIQNGVCVDCGYRESQGLEYQETDGGYEIIGRGTCADTQIYIPQTYQGQAVVAIAVEAFKDQTDITFIKVPSSVNLIEKGAFKGCTALEELIIPFVGREVDSSSYNYIGYIFGSNGYDQNMDYTPASLRKLIITGGHVRSNALYSCNNVKEIHILDGATVTLGVNSTHKTYGGLRNCTSVEKLTLPKGASVTQYQSFYLGAYFGGTYTNWVQIPSSLKFLSIRGGLYCNISNFDSNYPNVVDLVIGSSLTHASINIEEVDNLFYEGTEEEYNAMGNKPNNYYGTTNIYYYSAEKPATEGNFWHWGDDGVTPVAWNIQGVWKFDSMKTVSGGTTTEINVGDEGVTEDYVVIELMSNGIVTRTDMLSGTQSVLTGRWQQVGSQLLVTIEEELQYWYVDENGKLKVDWSTGSSPNWIFNTIYLNKA